MAQTRTQTKLAPLLASKQATLNTMGDELNSNLGAIDEKLADTMCYLCAGAEGPLNSTNTMLTVCSHACHIMCEVRGRTILFERMREALRGDSMPDGPISEVCAGVRCGLCRYKFVGNDRVDLAQVCTTIKHCKTPLHATDVRSMNDLYAQRKRELEVQSDKIDLAKGTFDGTYGPDRPYPPQSFDQSCVVM